jgi:hypothetical protein
MKYVLVCQLNFDHRKAGAGDAVGCGYRSRCERPPGRGIRLTLAFKRFIQEELEEKKDPDAVAHRITRDWLDKSGFTFFPDEVMFYISRGMIKNALQEKVD